MDIFTLSLVNSVDRTKFDISFTSSESHSIRILSASLYPWDDGGAGQGAVVPLWLQWDFRVVSVLLSTAVAASGQELSVASGGLGCDSWWRRVGLSVSTWWVPCTHRST